MAVALAIYLGGAVWRSPGPGRRWPAGGIVALAAVALGCSAARRRSPGRLRPLAGPGLGAMLVLMAWRPLATGGTSEYLGSLAAARWPG